MGLAIITMVLRRICHVAVMIVAVTCLVGSASGLSLKKSSKNNNNNNKMNNNNNNMKSKTPVTATTTTTSISSRHVFGATTAFASLAAITSSLVAVPPTVAMAAETAGTSVGAQAPEFELENSRGNGLTTLQQLKQN